MEKRRNYPIRRKSELDKSELIFGTRPVLEAIDAGKEIDKLFVQRDLKSPALREIIEEAGKLKIPVQQVPIEKLNRLTRKNHQGAVGILSAVSYASLDHVIQSAFERGHVPLLVMLDRITDVRNFGAIARTAECAGADAVIIPSKGSASITGDAVKTSAGALHHLPVVREENLKNTIDFLKESGFVVIACTEKSEKTVYDIDLTGPTVLLMGSEEDGISPEYLKRANEKVGIPLHGKIESLNVSVATGVMIFEVLRQRRIS